MPEKRHRPLCRTSNQGSLALLPPNSRAPELSWFYPSENIRRTCRKINQIGRRGSLLFQRRVDQAGNERWPRSQVLKVTPGFDNQGSESAFSIYLSPVYCNRLL